jgi:uncharacterized protein
MPPVADAESLLDRAGCSEQVKAHCRAVRDIALLYVEQGTPDAGLVEAGAILHDIGRGATHSILHAQAGADLCREYGVPEEICRIVERHTGAGLTQDECSLIGLAPRDCMPVTLPERIVAHADNIACGSGECSLERLLIENARLPRRIKKRICRLARDIELFR